MYHRHIWAEKSRWDYTWELIIPKMTVFEVITKSEEKTSREQDKVKKTNQLKITN